jgi:hypothetical protein
LTIEAAVQLAFKSDPDVKKAELNVEQAQIARDELAQHVDWIPTGGMVLPAYQELFNTFQQAEISLGVAKKVQATQKDLVAKNVIAAYNQSHKGQKQPGSGAVVAGTTAEADGDKERPVGIWA